MLPVALTIAGSDPTSGAGLAADLRAFAVHGVWGCAIPSLITVQSTRGVTRVIPLDASDVIEPLNVLREDVVIAAWKTGALGMRETVERLASVAPSIRAPLVIDPVLVSSSGAVLLDVDARAALVRKLFPRASLVTPNAPEAALLTGRTVRTLAEARNACRALVDLGAPAVLLKGGHLEVGDDAVDVLLLDGELHELVTPRIALARRVHGTGCALSAAITARLARGEALVAACRGGKEWLTSALRGARALGGGDLVIDFPDARVESGGTTS